MVASMDSLPPAAAATSSSAKSGASKSSARRVATLLIDNYDSYTYNLFQMLAQVNDRTSDCGAAPSVVVVKNDDYGGQWSVAWDAFLAQMHAQAGAESAEFVYNVVLSPGPGHPAVPQDFGMCAEAIRHATVPVLGVCLGHQGLAQVYGGRVVEAPEVMHGRTSRVFFAQHMHHEGSQPVHDALFDFLPDGFEVVRYHSLTIEPESVPKELQVLARTQDGVIMAVRHRTKPHFGVQFHPEAVCSRFGYQLLQNLRDLTLGQSASLCVLHHSEHRDDIGSVACRAKTAVESHETCNPNQVIVQQASTALASLQFAAFAFAELFGTSKRSFWLDSSNSDLVAGSDAAAQSRISMMGDDSGPLSYCVEYNVAPQQLRVRRRSAQHGGSESVDVFPGQEILTHVREVTQARQAHDLVRLDSDGAQGHRELPFAFRGGFVGYFGYEVLGSEQESEGKTRYDAQQTERAPDASFLFADRTLVFDHHEGVIYSLSLSDATQESGNSSREWHAAISQHLGQLVEAFHAAEAMESSPLEVTTQHEKDAVVFHPSRTRAQYVADIDEIQRLIRSGETYEVCLTNQLRAKYALRDPLAFYCMLRRRNPAPFAGFYLSNPHDRFQSAGDAATGGSDSYALCCSSPERFLRVANDGWMESKPIKGTRPRGREPDEDAAIAAELACCEKDRAENMMIADLVRNDFGIVARVGSVHVPRLMRVETYTTVHQLVTTVRAQRRDDADVVGVLKATFPGGSMTGAPKKRTMRIIRGLERAPRGVYSGALGFVSIDGSCDLNIVIRTAIVTPNAVTLGAGGAIVALSDSDDEYDEMLLKARALVATVGVFATGRDDGSGAKIVVT